LRYRPSFVAVAALLTERGIQVDQSTVYAWVQKFTSLSQEAARARRCSSGRGPT
jgi:transposase-like protein